MAGLSDALFPSPIFWLTVVICTVGAFVYRTTVMTLQRRAHSHRGRKTLAHIAELHFSRASGRVGRGGLMRSVRRTMTSLGVSLRSVRCRHAQALPANGYGHPGGGGESPGASSLLVNLCCPRELDDHAVRVNFWCCCDAGFGWGRHSADSFRCRSIPLSSLARCVQERRRKRLAKLTRRRGAAAAAATSGPGGRSGVTGADAPKPPSIASLLRQHSERDEEEGNAAAAAAGRG